MDKDCFQDMLVKRAVQTGFSDCEVYYEGGKSFEVMIYEGEIAHYENSVQQGVSFRGLFNGSMGYAYSEKVEEDAIDYLVKEAMENACIIENEEEEPLYGGEEEYPALEGFSEALAQIRDSQKIEDAKRMEASAKGQSSEIMAVDYCLNGYSEGEVSIKNSRGLSVSYRNNCATAYVSAIAQRGNDIKTAGEYFIGQDYASFKPEEMGKAAAGQAVSHLGAESTISGDYSVVLKNQVMSDLLATFSGVFFAENIQKGFSLLGDKKGTAIASSGVTLRDDGLLEGGFGSAPFDSEGVSCKNKAVIEKGILQTLLYNLKSAQKDGVPSTGNGFKPSFQSPVVTACTNFYLEKGSHTQAELFSLLKDGLYITEVAGLHSGANSISGDFSLSAEGFLIKDGKIDAPVEQITIAGNFYELLNRITETGNDLRFNLPSGGGVFGSPSVLIEKMAVAGL